MKRKNTPQITLMELCESVATNMSLIMAQALYLEEVASRPRKVRKAKRVTRKKRKYTRRSKK